jgi:aerobic C4-dicarboxylate transport protein
MKTHAETDTRLQDSPLPKPFYRKLGFQIAVSLVLGIGVGLVFPKFGASLKVLGDIFLALIKAGVAPLVFLTIVTGIASAGDVKSAGRVGWRAIVYFEVVSTIAIIVGLVAGNLMQIGKGAAIAVSGAAVPAATAQATPPTFMSFVMHMVPDNFIGAFAKGEMLQVVVLAVIVGIGILSLRPERRAVVADGLDYVADVLFAFINIIMKLAPIGTFGAIAYSVGSNGTAVLLALAKLIVSYYAVVAIFVVVVLGAILWLTTRINVFRLMRYLKEELILTLGTASSEPALPRLLVKLEDLGCSKQSVGLVLPTGYAFNLDGTSLYMSLGILFLANAFGIPLSIDQQIGMLLLMLLTSKGAATVSGGTFVVFAATVTSSGIIPVEGLALMFGVYRFMSMATAFCNVFGNSVATVVVAKWAKEFDPVQARSELHPEPIRHIPHDLKVG